MADLSEAYRSRLVCELWLRKTCGLLDSLLVADTSGKVNDLLSAREQVTSRLETWDSLTSNIERLVPEESIELEVDRCYTYRQNIVDMMNRADSAIALIYDVNNVPNNDSVVESSTISNSQFLFKLPKITLPPFYGEIVKWTSYWEIFNSMVHDIGSYSDITKMIYLVSSLKGDASNIIKGLAVTAGNYPLARKALEERFGRKDIIIQSHVQYLLDDLKVTSSETSGFKYIKALWCFYDQIMLHVRSLDNLGVNGSQVEIFLSVIILRNVPLPIRQKWCELAHEREREDDLESLCNFLYQTITNL